jgi:ParB family chromosome partitioning protein
MKENMSDKKLGRGLSALFGESKMQKDLPTPGSGNNEANSVQLISINKIIAGIYQPRIHFNQSELEELADSIKENGLIQPIILRKADEDDQYEIIAGERRFRACKIAGLSEIPAMVKKINNHEALELAIVENIQRSDLSLIEEANGYKQLIEEFSYTQEQIAKKVGKSRSHITNLLRLLTLPQNIHDLLNENLISMGHARAIINSENPEKLAKKIIENSLTVRDAEDLVRDEKMENRNIPVLVRTESKVKFVNNEYLSGLEGKICEILGMESKISYNSLKNTGKITIKFDEFEKIQYFIDKLQTN